MTEVASEAASIKGDAGENQVSTTTSVSKAEIDDKRKKNQLSILQFTRYVNAILVVYGHYFRCSEAKDDLMPKGAVFTVNIMSSGFLLAYTYGKKDAKNIDVTEFFVKRWAALYPLYFVSIMLGFFYPFNPYISSDKRPYGLLLVLLFNLSGFVPTAFINPVSMTGWTVGASFVLYLVFPYALRMMKAVSPRHRLFVLAPLLYLFSTVKPLLDLNYNLGIISGFARLASVIALPDFLQGINVALLFLDYGGKKKNLKGSQQKALVILVCMAAALPFLVKVTNVKHSPFMNLWSNYGLWQPLLIPRIFFAAGGRRLLANITSHPCVSYLGNTAYGVYLFQHFGYVNRIGYPNFLLFIFYLTVTGAIGYQYIQLPCKKFFTTHGLHILKVWRSSQALKILSKMASLIESDAGRILTVASFFLTAIYYVNWQPCLPTQHFLVPYFMTMSRWFQQYDYNSIINLYAIPCHPRRLIPYQLSYVMQIMTLVLLIAAVCGHLALYVSRRHLIPPMQRMSVKEGKEKTDDEKLHQDGDDAQAIVLRLISFPHDSLESIQHTTAWMQHVILAHGKQDREIKVQMVVDDEMKDNDDKILSHLPQEQRNSVSIIFASSATMGLAEARKGCTEKEASGIIITMPVASRLTVQEMTYILHTVSHEPSEVKLFTLDIDGSDDVLPSLGTLAELSPFTNMSRPILVACTVNKDQTVIPSSIVAAVQYGILTDNLRLRSQSTSTIGHHTTTSLPAYIRRRFSMVTHTAKFPWLSPQKSQFIFHLATEAAIHFTFLLSTLLLVGTPIHESYGGGSYCSAYRELMKCKYGLVRGFHTLRIFPATLAAIYSAAHYNSFLKKFHASDGGIIRIIILTSLLFACMPITALVDGVFCMVALVVIGKKREEEEDARIKGGGSESTTSMSPALAQKKTE